MKKPNRTGRTLLQTALLATALGAQNAHAGPAPAPEKAPPGASSNPLSFFDGRVVFDVQERLRFEVREDNFDFDNDRDSLTDDSWLLQRFRIGVKVKPANWLTLYAQGQDSREYFSDRPVEPGMLGAEGDDAFDLRQGYIEIGDLSEFPLTLRVGRQVLSYGDERLVGSFDWNNIGRTFDGAKLHFEQPKWWLDAFAATVARPTRNEYNQSDLFNGTETNRSQVFGGIYLSTSVIPVQTTDVYAIYLHENTTVSPAPPNEDTNFATFGVRMKSNPGAFAPAPPAPPSDGKSAPAKPAPRKPVGFEYEFEGAMQIGEVLGRDHNAYAVHGGIGYTFDCWGSPRIFGEYNYATGDEDPLDGDSQTFQNLFPTNHKFYGYMDAFSWQNVHNAALSLRVAPAKNLTLQIDGHAFWVATNEDAWYRANGTTRVRPLNRDADTYVGSEIDVTATWKATKNLALLVGYSHFFSGDYAKATGRNDDADFTYVQATLEF